MKKFKRYTAGVTSALLGISLLPILYLCRYVHATGDDYGYGTLTHAAWLDTHSLIEVLKAAVETVKDYYGAWQGTWWSVFLFSLQPEVFSPNAYWIVPIIMLALTIIGVTIFNYYFLKKAGVGTADFIVADCLIIIMLLQFVPSTKSGIFWYNGTAHYVVPFFLALLAIVMAGCYMDTYKISYFVGVCICMILLGGSSYLAALLAPLSIGLLWLWYGHRGGKDLYLLIPIGMEVVGLTISLLAPGNIVRGGEDLGFSWIEVAETIFQSFKSGILTVCTYLREKTALFLIMALFAAIMWFALDEQKESSHMDMGKGRRYRWPGVFVAAMFCLYCAMFSPGIYAGTQLSGGVPNTIFQVFVMALAASVVYVEGWIKQKWPVRAGRLGNKKKIKWFAMFLVLLSVGLYAGRASVKQTTFFVCLDYIASGQAAVYGAQMDERLEILLEENVSDAKLPAMNQDQGPLMHMEVTKDKDAWTNKVVREFYRKNSVVEIDREAGGKNE